MNKIAALIVTVALAAPVFVQGAIPPELKDESRKIEVKKPKVSKFRKGKKPPVLPAVSRLHNPDFPWQMPS